MHEYRFRKFVLFSALFLVVAVYGFPLGGLNVFGQSCAYGTLCVYFLDVGQGDATLVRSPQGMTILIDGGPGPAVLRELGSVLGHFDRDIDMIVATHPDADHIGGLTDVLRRYRVKAALLSGNTSDTPVAGAFEALLKEEEAHVLLARSGQRIDIGGAIIDVLFPDRNPAALESNTASLVFKLRYGEADILFMGDAPEAIEDYLVRSYGKDLESEVLKVGHHGSRTSTGAALLSVSNPKYAVIFVGSDNPYGHPHAEVVEALKRRSVSVLTTAEHGSVLFESDGSQLKIK